MGTLKENKLEYKSWDGMKSRCLNPNNDKYERYGGRGIKVCDRWANSFKDFLTDMGKRPSKKYSIDRIDNDGNYEPSNCRWATKAEQECNKGVRKDNKIGVTGITMLPSGNYWARVGINKKVYSLGVFKTLDEAVEARKKGVEIYHP